MLQRERVIRTKQKGGEKKTRADELLKKKKQLQIAKAR